MLLDKTGFGFAESFLDPAICVCKYFDFTLPNNARRKHSTSRLRKLQQLASVIVSVFVSAVSVLFVVVSDGFGHGVRHGLSVKVLCHRIWE